jgi:hypothetical protein
MLKILLLLYMKEQLGEGMGAIAQYSESFLEILTNIKKHAIAKRRPIGLLP